MKKETWIKNNMRLQAFIVLTHYEVSENNSDDRKIIDIIDRNIISIIVRKIDSSHRSNKRM